MTKNKKILLTGSTGFLGNHVIHYLLNHNYTIITSSRNEEKAKKFKWCKKTVYKKFNIGSYDNPNVFEYLDKPDKLIHLSWDGLPNYNELFHIEKNLPDNYNFIKNMILGGLKDLTVIGTCFEYGLQNGCLSEEDYTLPSTSYALAKDTLRKFIEEFSKKYDFKFRWVRIFYLYGAGQSENSLFSQLDRAAKNKEKVLNMSSGEQLRDYLPIEKAVEYISKIALQDKTLGVINCCSGKPISVRKLVEDYIKAKNIDIKLNLGFYPIPSHEPMAFWGNDTKLKKIISEK